MDLLPTTPQDFGSSAYWNTFFKKTGAKAFEWYGEYNELCGLLHKYMKPAEAILVAGCGNSSLSGDLYDDGYKNITNIDISDVVVRQMTDKRPDMTWMQGDITCLQYDDSSFNVVLDKGTLDALMTNTTAEVVDVIDKMFAEIDRVLRLGGRYICLTLAQDHILHKLTTYFSALGWPVRACRVDENDDSEKEYHEVFMFICTKFRKMANSVRILEVAQFERQPQRLDSVESFVKVVKSLQYFGVVRRRLSNKEHLTCPVQLELHGAGSKAPRYTLHVVDTEVASSAKFAVFIVPEGRETDWLFASEAGRAQLATSAGYQRLVVVVLHPDHTYAGMDQVKAELSSRVLKLAPPASFKTPAPFLSLGDEINTRRVCYRGDSQYSGPFVVEEVDIDGDTFRRLIFHSNRYVIQSEARIVSRQSSAHSKGRRKNRPKTGEKVVDVGWLCDAHQMAMVAGLSLIDGVGDLSATPLSVVLIGLGGGSLASYLLAHLPLLSLHAVELDPHVVKVAEDWFSLKPNNRLSVHVQDGLEYINQLHTTGRKYDAIILDVDSKDTTEGLTSPPAAFLESGTLESINAALSARGVFILNTACRNADLRTTLLAPLSCVFGTVLAQSVPEVVNEIVYALPSSRKLGPDAVLEESVLPLAVDSLKSLQKCVSSTRAANDIQDLSQSMSGLRLLS